MCDRMPKPQKKILLVEDNHHEAEAVQDKLKTELPDLDLLFIVCATEYEFQTKLAGPDLNALDLAIVDIILPWATIAPDMPPIPLEVKDGGNARAGIRCKDKLLENAATKDVYIILISYLDEDALRAGEVRGAKFVAKTADQAELVAEVRNRLTSVAH